MRLFVGIGLPKNIKDYLFELQRNIGSQYAKIKWVEKKNLHLTLKFLGEVHDDKFQELKDRFKDIRYNNFKLKLNNFGYFPGGSIINVIWVDVVPENKVTELRKLVDYKTLSFGDIKLGSPHITLGRVKSLKNRKMLFDKINKVKVKEIEFNVNTFYLFRSILSKDGPVYDVLEEYKLE